MICRVGAVCRERAGVLRTIVVGPLCRLGRHEKMTFCVEDGNGEVWRVESNEEKKPAGPLIQLLCCIASINVLLPASFAFNTFTWLIFDIVLSLPM